MTLRLLALLIALALIAWVPQVRAWRNFRWFDGWVAQCADTHRAWRVLLVLAPPAIAAAIIGRLLGATDWLVIVWLIYAVLMLIYTFGPRHLESDIDAVLGAPDADARLVAAQALRVHADDGAVLPPDPPALVEGAMRSALKRRFGTVFWFIVLGPGGALLYRLAQRLGDDAETDGDSRASARRFAEAMDWIPAHLMVFAMALVSDFDAVIGAWRAWHDAPTRPPDPFECGFLGAVARASVDADVVAGDEGVIDTASPAIELADARRLLLRMLLVWLAMIAVIVLVSWIA